MYLLDTNIISELRKAPTGKAHANVVLWAESVASVNLYISVITILEIEKGILKIARQDESQAKILRTWFDDHVIPAFIDRILPIDIRIAKQCAALHIPDPQPERDAIIAATALVHGLELVTRNTKDFDSLPLTLINPWIS